MSSHSEMQMELDFYNEGPREYEPPLPKSKASKPKASPPQDPDLLEVHAKRISGLLTVLLPYPVDVLFTDNRSTMISYKIKLGRLEVRLHRMFRLANNDVLGALALFLVGKKSGSKAKILDKFIADNSNEIVRKKRSPRVSSLDSHGQFYDLDEILGRVKKRYFGNVDKVTIGWGRAPRAVGRRRRETSTRTRALGTYNFDDQTIRVNPLLDSERVPVYVLEWVVYHEMLHHVLPIEERGGRRQFHTNRFRALERAFDNYEQAKKWEKANLDWLLK